MTDDVQQDVVEPVEGEEQPTTEEAPVSEDLTVGEDTPVEVIPGEPTEVEGEVAEEPVADDETDGETPVPAEEV